MIDEIMARVAQATSRWWQHDIRTALEKHMLIILPDTSDGEKVAEILNKYGIMYYKKSDVKILY